MIVRFPLCSMAMQRPSPQLSPSPTSSSSTRRDSHGNSPVYQQALLSLHHPSCLHCMCSHNTRPTLLSLPCMSLSSQNQPVAPCCSRLDTRLRRRVQTVEQLHRTLTLNSHFPAKTRAWLWQQSSPRAQPPGGQLSPENPSGRSTPAAVLRAHPWCRGWPQRKQCQLPSSLALSAAGTCGQPAWPCLLVGQGHAAFVEEAGVNGRHPSVPMETFLKLSCWDPGWGVVADRVSFPWVEGAVMPLFTYSS